MAKFTINVMGLEQGKRLMDLIMQSVKREGKYELPIRNNVQPEDLMANKLVAYQVLTRKIVKNYPRADDVYEYNAGVNFANADVKGAHKFIEEEKKRLDPSYLMRSWNKISNNALISSIVGAIIGAIIGAFITIYFQNDQSETNTSTNSIKDNTKKHVALGTWNRCNKDGSYIEYKITDQYMLILTTTRPDEVIIFGNKVLDDNLISYQLKNGTKILTDNDTLVTAKQSPNKVVLMSTWGFDKYELNKAEFDFDKIDSTNLEQWKNKSLAEFKKRAKSANCPDLRTEEEKIVPTLNLDNLDEEEIPIIEIEK